MTTAPHGAPAAPLLVGASEAARLLAISPRTLWAMTKAGRVPCARIGGRVLYRPSSLAAYAAAQEQGGSRD